MTDCVEDEPTARFPKLRVVALRLRAGEDALSWIAKDFVVPFAVAEMTPLWLLVIDAAVAVNPTLDPPPAMVTLAGTVSEVLLLLRVTACPPVGAAALSDTVQASDPAPEREELEHVKAPRAAMPVPVRPTELVDPAEEEPLTVSCPGCVPAEVGEK